MTAPDDITAAEAPKTKSNLGLSPVTYGLGESVKTGLLGLLGIGAAMTLLVRYGKNLPGVSALGALPEKISNFFKTKVFKENSSEWGSAIAIGLGVGTIGSYFTHIPGLFSGIKKVKQQEKVVDAKFEENVRLIKATAVQAEEIAQLREKLAKIERSDPLAGRDAETAHSR